MKAHFILNGQAKLNAYASQIGPNDLVVCAAGMNPAQIRAAGVSPLAKLYAYFNADASVLYGQGNPVYDALRAAIHRHIYNPLIFDPPHTTAPLLKPSFQAADNYAHFIIEEVRRAGWSGVYGDQSWATKPQRFVLWEASHYHTDRDAVWAQRQVLNRWRAYVGLLWMEVSREGIPLMLNCGGDVPIQDAAVTICRETPSTGTWQQRLNSYARLVRACSPLQNQGVLWYGGPELTDNQIIEGVEIPDPSGAAPPADMDPLAGGDLT